MSGFLGLVRLDGAPLSADLLEKFRLAAAADQPHRFANRWASPSGEMALTRLHNGILNPAAQPVSSPDGKLLLFLEGEVYNEDLDLNDQPQAILDAYLKEGPALFKRLNGQYLLALIEPESHRLHLVCDRTGSVPLFWVRLGDLLAFSPRIKPLLSLPGLQPRLDYGAMANFLSTGCILEGKCLVQDVQLLRQGQVMTVERRTVEIHPYWEFSYTDQRDQRDPKVLTGELSDLVVQAVHRQTRDSLSYAVPLSGGYDSRSILCSLRRLYPALPIHTVTWGADDLRPDSDVMVAQRLAEYFRTLHSFYRLDAEALPDHFHAYVQASEGRVDAAGNYPESLGVLERIRRDLDVDILFRGNEFFGARAAVSRYRQALYVGFLPTFCMQPASFRYLRPEVYHQLSDLCEAQMRRIINSYPYDNYIDRKDHLFIAERFYAYHNPLTQLKRLVVEERNPLLDNDIIEFVRRLPPRLRIWKALFQMTARCIMPEFDRIGVSRVVSLVDWDLRLQQDGKLQKFVRSTLLEHRNGFDKIVDPDRLARHLDKVFAPRKINPRSLARRIRRKIFNRLDRYDLPKSEEIFRLMILKIWVEDYLQGNFDPGR